MSKEDAILARQEMLVEDLQKDLQGIITAVKEKSNGDVVAALNSVFIDLNKTFKSIKVNSPEIDLSPIKEAIESINIDVDNVVVDTSSLDKTISKYADNLLSLESKIDGLKSDISELVSAIKMDTKISVERNNSGQIINLFLIKDNNKK